MGYQTIMSLGSDQMANQFQFLFPLGIPSGGDKDAISLRMDQAFDPPEETLGTYDIFYRGLKMTKTGTLEETDKTISASFRLDQQWGVYDAFNSWMNMVYDRKTLTAMDESIVRTNVSVHYYGRDNSIAATMNFYGVVIKSLKIEQADPSSGDPLRIATSFSYFYSEKS